MFYKTILSKINKRIFFSFNFRHNSRLLHIARQSISFRFSFIIPNEPTGRRLKIWNTTGILLSPIINYSAQLFPITSIFRWLFQIEILESNFQFFSLFKLYFVVYSLFKFSSIIQQYTLF